MSVNMSETSSRPWTPFSRSSSSSTNSSVPQSSSASVRSFGKRTSFFFGRTRSNAGKVRLQLSPLQPATEQEDEEPARHPTAHSTQTAQSRREPLNAIRNTLLGGRRRVVDEQTRSTRDSDVSSIDRNHPLSPTSSLPVREEFKSGEQYYHHLRKQSISPPFNFEHRAHTAKTQLPPLETVNEQDLKREFWSASSRHRPRRHLHGIQADDILKQHISSDGERSRPVTAKSEPVSPISRSDVEDDQSHVVTPIEPIARLDEPVFHDADKIEAARVDSVRIPPQEEFLARLPRRSASLNALKIISQDATHLPNPSTTFYESDSSNTSGGGTKTIVPESASPSFDPFPPPTVPVESPKQEELEFRSTQPLPPVPIQTSIKRYRNNSLRQVESIWGPSVSLRIPAQQTGSPMSKRSSRHSSRSSRSIRKSPSQTSSSDVRQSISISDTTWEDDVDFIYEQEAESTCNFNWSVGRNQHAGSVESSGNAIAACESYHAHSPGNSGSNLPTPMNVSRETIAERRYSRRGDEPSRALSVGHRGFLAARRSSQDSSRFANPIHITPNSSHASLLSPVVSISDGDGNADKTTYPTPALQYPAATSANSFCFSDPESCRNSGSTCHRQSSSYSSHESRYRHPATIIRDTTARWSLASATSLPELTHTRPKSKLILSKTIISKPLETLPQSPPYEIDRGMDSPIVPREFQTQPVRQSFIMRRPQTPSDRAVVQAAGRMVQDRGARTASPPPMRRLTPEGYGPPNMDANRAEWI